jgi:two-component system, NtrC family, sensor kinase
MNLSVRLRIASVVIITLIATVLGIWNLSDRVRWNDPTDGFVWRLSGDGLRAILVSEKNLPHSPLIHVGDIVLEINKQPIRSEGDYFRLLYEIGVGGQAQYLIARAGDGAQVSVPVVIGAEAIITPTDFFRAFIAFTYLIIGVILGMRHWRSPGAQHFYAVCLLSYVLYLFTYTNRVSDFDLVVYWISAAALLLLPPVFLQFCLSFPNQPPATRHWPAVRLGIYIPFAILLPAHMLWAMGRLAGFGLPRNAAVNEFLDKVHIGYFAIYFISAAGVLARAFWVERDPFRKQQLKWVSLGTLTGIAPFFSCYVVPFLFGFVPNMYQEASSLLLSLIPLSFAYAVIRYKLMDVDIIFKRGLTHVLAGSLTLAGYFLLVVTGDRLLSRLVPGGRAVAVGAAALTIAFLFAPLRKKIQSLLDRAFYRQTFDYRDSLLEFARALTSEISLDRLAKQILARIKDTFEVSGVGLLLEVPNERYLFQVIQSEGLDQLPPGKEVRLVPPGNTVLLRGDEDSPDEPLGGLEALSLCRVNLLQPFASRGRVVGLLAMSARRNNDFFTTEDFKLLQLLAGYAAIALENAALYHSLETKASQIEQLKTFNENIIESINVGIVSIDLTGKVTACNGAFEKLCGMLRARVIGLSIEQVFSADIIRALETRTGTSDWFNAGGASLYKHYLLTREGKAVIVNLFLVPLYDPRQLRRGTLLVLDDMTEKLWMEDQLRQSEKLSSIGLLAAGVAHEVNTPIAGISSYTQMLLRQTLKDDPKYDLLSKIEKQTFRAAEIVNNMLNFSRMSESRFDHLDVNKLIRESLSLLEHQLRSGKIEVQARLEEDTLVTFGNSNKLQQVLVNLMLNAKDAMPSGGRLEIRTQRANGNILIDISDTGQGMTEEVLNHIYDPFYTTKDSGRGTGLGLAVSYGIIQEHSGRIFVESTPGVGTHFQVKLPASRVN